MASNFGPSTATRVLGIALMVIAVPLVLISFGLLVSGEVGAGLFLTLLTAVLLLGAYKAMRADQSSPTKGAGHLNVTVTTSAAPQRSATRIARNGEHAPPRPTGEPIDPWTTKTVYAEVAGETYRQDEIRRVFAGTRYESDAGAEIMGQALLSDDSANPYDGNAVAVWFNGEHVGYLSADDAEKYSPIVRELAAQGRVLRVEARAWARERQDDDYYGSGLGARITVFPPADPIAIRPVNNLPEGPHVVLPTGRAVQVTKEDQHMTVLGEVVAHGTGSGIVATLHAVEEQRARSTTELVEVRYNGQRIGVLSAQMSNQLLSLVKYIEARDKVPVARATVVGSRLQADVTLNVARAAEVDDAWLSKFVDAGGPA
ncbi:HIRAN domain-containing protein [Promicromonospora kroppenstedtii]|uniref:HIRAN domain-containing protein n=1 Tax=Promicromonospora kroppenstedtii TaxID=440482 RepID=A0ABW7XLY3_9MICO